MRQGYIDSQGNKYILTGVKAQFPRWTYAEWQAEGEPDIPWIRTDAPSGYRKVSGNDVSYDNTHSVNEKIDEVNGKQIKFTNLLEQLNIPTTAASYNCAWSSYTCISVELIFYSNVREQILVPTSYFSGTSVGNRIQVQDAGTSKLAEIYKNGNNAVYLKMGQQEAAWGVRIYGMKLA